VVFVSMRSKGLSESEGLTKTLVSRSDLTGWFGLAVYFWITPPPPLFL
jgi:hypothetical protein